MTPQALKSAILQLAIQGKLVPQRPEDGSADALLRQLAQSSNSPRHSKSSRPLPLRPKSYVLSPPFPPGTEPPLDIPETWCWVRLGDCTTYAARKEKVLPSAIPFDTWSLDLEDIEKDTGKIINHCPASARRITGEKVVFRKGQILYSKLRPYLKKILVAPQDGICTPELVPFSVFDGIDANYMVAVLRSPHVDFAINSVTYGVKMPRVGTETMVNLPIPLPPLPEQHRIVAKIEELLPLIDRYEQAWTKLEDFNRRFPADMQKSLLQMAIQGQLVEQRPEEGTAETLYRQIQSEKHRLVQSGKIKKEKPLPEITEAEIPFDIPATWKWVRFGELGNYKKGPFGSAITKSMFVPKGNGAIKIYEQKNAIQKDASLGDYYIRREYFESKLKGFELAPGDIIVSCAGTIGETYVMPDEFEKGIINQALMRMNIFKPLYIPYFLLFFDFMLKRDAIRSSKGSAIKNIPPFEILKNYLVPLPPLAEQERIVAKLEELLPLCERLK